MQEEQNRSRMLRNSIIDLAAIGGRIDVDCSDMKPVTKELAKIGIGLSDEALKGFFDSLEKQMRNASSECRTDLITAAKHCGVQRITCATILQGDRSSPWCFIEGGNIPLFCQMAGIVCFPETTGSETASALTDFIRTHGSIIYLADA